MNTKKVLFNNHCASRNSDLQDRSGTHSEWAYVSQVFTIQLVYYNKLVTVYTFAIAIPLKLIVCIQLHSILRVCVIGIH
jgi:hypothetical protein